jgi:hypothetical protein
MLILPPLAAYAIIVLVALALYTLGLRLAKYRSLAIRSGLLLVGLLLALPALIYTIYYLNLYDDAPWLLALHSAPFAEYYAAGFGFLPGCITGWLPESRFARLAKHGTLIPLLVFWLIVPFLKPLLTPLSMFTVKNQWHDNICMQTTPATCGPASAATLQAGRAASTAARYSAAEPQPPASSSTVVARDVARSGRPAFGHAEAPQLPTTTVVTPCRRALSIHGSVNGAKSECVWTSTKPGASARPAA